MNVLEAVGVSVRFGSFQALDGVDIAVESGSIHGLIGPNGAGKSTLIDVLSGRRRPTSGTVRLKGEDVTGSSVRRIRHSGLARSFQRTSVFPEMTVGDQLELVARKVGEPDLGEVVDAMDLVEHLDSTCGSIGYGDQRRVDIALALLGRPQILLLDEPAAGLGAAESLGLADHIKSLVTQRHVTVLIVEHDLDVVFRICDVLTVLATGQLLAHGSPAQVRNDPQVVEAYLGASA